MEDDQLKKTRNDDLKEMWHWGASTYLQSRPIFGKNELTALQQRI